jgi:NAD(P)-dependent dehydrogenase (short-subunit alcohol dehydrogenase family)
MPKPPPTQTVQAPSHALDLTGTVTVLTGGTNGIGRALANALAAAGTELFLAGRDQSRTAAVADELRSHDGAPVHEVALDLASLTSVRQATKGVTALTCRIDYLICNGGVAPRPGATKQVTEDGYEQTIAVNHLAHAELVFGLLPLVATSGRITMVASDAHRRTDENPIAALLGHLDFEPDRNYQLSKLANVQFARELASRLPDPSATVYSIHPGGVDTGMLQGVLSGPRQHVYEQVRPLLLSTDEAAQGVLRVAVDPGQDAATGSYFELGKLDEPAPRATDRMASEELWADTLRLLDRAAEHPWPSR